MKLNSGVSRGFEMAGVAEYETSRTDLGVKLWMAQRPHLCGLTLSRIGALPH
jgi:hypothetical protein